MSNSWIKAVLPGPTGCISLWLMLLLWALDTSLMGVQAREIGTWNNSRFQDEPFPRKMIILNQTVTCGELHPGKFVARTFTCPDLRVDGKRLAYGFYPGWAAGDGRIRCQDTKGIHEFAQLCRLMMAYYDKVDLGFKAVYIPNSTCSHMNERRKLLKKVSENEFKWTEIEPGYGWTYTIQCMTSE